MGGNPYGYLRCPNDGSDIFAVYTNYDIYYNGIKLEKDHKNHYEVLFICNKCGRIYDFEMGDYSYMVIQPHKVVLSNKFESLRVIAINADILAKVGKIRSKVKGLPNYTERKHVIDLFEQLRDMIAKRIGITHHSSYRLHNEPSVDDAIMNEEEMAIANELVQLNDKWVKTYKKYMK